MAMMIDEKVLAETIGRELNDAMLKAAEPILQKALKEIEIEMRAKMAARLIAYIESNFSIERHGQDIRILIKQAKAGS